VLKKYGREEIRFASAADKLKWYRHSLGLMQEEVANLCNVPRQAYRRLEAGELNLFPHEGMLKIAKLFEIEVEALLDDYNRFMFGGQGDAVRAIRRETGMNITLIREAGKDHTQNPRETAVMRRALMAPNRCEKAKAMV
jgi:DNA-binding XRE family transcriptional regulator